MTTTKIDKPHLKSVILEGYRSIQHVETDFASGLNIIIGVNGAGKTNFLSFLEEALEMEYYEKLNFRAEFKLIKEKSSLSIIANSTSDINKDDSFVSVNSIKYSITDDKGKKEETTDSTVVKTKIFGGNFYYSSEFIKHSLPLHFPLFTEYFRFSVDFKKGGVSDELFATLFNKDAPYFIQSALASTFFELQRNSKNLEDFFETEVELFQKSLFESFIKHTNSILNIFTPITEIRLSDKIKIWKDVELNKMNVENLAFEFKVGKNWLPFSQLSDGTKRLFYIISNVSATDDYYFTSFGFGVTVEPIERIILIEEPELGIHPHQLRKLMDFLKEQSQDKQIIITTHSPQVLDVLGSEELDRIILCEYDNEKGTQLRRMTVEEKESAGKFMQKMYLSDFWRYTDFNDK
ncbi:MAG: AAA family ATPase [Bacteroidia bacterium]